MKARNVLLVTGVIAGVSLAAVAATHYYPQNSTPTHGTAPQTASKPDVQELYTLVNAERTKAGLQPLVHDARLEASAGAKCADMVANNYHDHVSPKGVRWDSFIQQQVGINYQYAGENLSEGYTASKGIVNGWMGSPSHRDNILKARFTNVGYAVCHTDNLSGEGSAYIAVQHFLQP